MTRLPTLMLLCVFLVIPSYSWTAEEKIIPDLNRSNYNYYRDYVEVYFCIQYHLKPFVPREESFTLRDHMSMLDRLTNCLVDFTDRNPDSEFAAEAKLMAAGFHRQMGVEDKLDRFSPHYSPSLYDKEWEKKTKKLLKNVIKNYSDDSYFSFIKMVKKDGRIFNSPQQTREKTAAIALYSLGKWFSKEKYFRRLIKYYPTSEYARYAVEEIKKLKEKGR